MEINFNNKKTTNSSTTIALADIQLTQMKYSKQQKKQNPFPNPTRVNTWINMIMKYKKQTKFSLYQKKTATRKRKEFNNQV